MDPKHGDAKPEFKKKRRIKNIRTSTGIAGISDKKDEGPAVVRPQRPSAQKAADRTQKSDSGSESSEEEGPGPKRLSFGVNYRSDKPIDPDRGTKVSEIDTAPDQDAQAIYERQLEINKARDGKSDDGLYRGRAGYKDYLPKQDTIKGKASSNLVRQGPYRAAANIRVTTRWDYQPDLCKDYKDTGFCGFGDSCKFVHDRTDYKAGWELERDYEAGLLSKAHENFEVESKPEEDTPTTCGICDNPLQSPVHTKCGHYFCGTCALKNHRVNPRCAVCSAETQGIFIYQKKGTAQANAPPLEGEHIVNEIDTSGSGSNLSSAPSD